MSSEIVDCWVTDTTPAANPVEGVLLKVFSDDGRLTYTQGISDAVGHVGFLLSSGLSYQVRSYKFGVSTPPPLHFTVTAGQSSELDIAVSRMLAPVPSDPRLCTAFGYFRDVTGAPQADVEIHFISKFKPVWLDGAAVVCERVVVRTDVLGYVRVNLIRNGHYDCTIQGEEDITRRIKVPDAPNVNLPDLVFPIVSGVLWTPAGPLTIPAGGNMLVGVQVFASDGENLGTGTQDTLISTTDQGVLSFSMEAGGLRLMAVKPGDAQIVIKRLNCSVVRIPDTGIVKSTLYVTVTP